MWSLETRARSSDFIQNIWEIIAEVRVGRTIRFELLKQSFRSRPDDKRSVVFWIGSWDSKAHWWKTG